MMTIDGAIINTTEKKFNLFSTLSFNGSMYTLIKIPERTSANKPRKTYIGITIPLFYLIFNFKVFIKIKSNEILSIIFSKYQINAK